MATELAPSVTDSDTADDIRASRIQRRPLVDAVSPGALAPATRAGVDEVFVQQIGGDHAAFFDAYRDGVLPRLS
jgi:hypothetical protein